jgi:hypothetical protein
MDEITLTEAERRSLRLVEQGNGSTTWYQIGRVLTPVEFPEQEINPVRVLARLEQAGLIEKGVSDGPLQPYRITALGLSMARADNP